MVFAILQEKTVRSPLNNSNVLSPSACISKRRNDNWGAKDGCKTRLVRWSLSSWSRELWWKNADTDAGLLQVSNKIRTVISAGPWHRQARGTKSYISWYTKTVAGNVCFTFLRPSSTVAPRVMIMMLMMMYADGWRYMTRWMKMTMMDEWWWRMMMMDGWWWWMLMTMMDDDDRWWWWYMTRWMKMTMMDEWWWWWMTIMDDDDRWLMMMTVDWWWWWWMTIMDDVILFKITFDKCNFYKCNS